MSDLPGQTTTTSLPFTFTQEDLAALRAAQAIIDQKMARVPDVPPDELARMKGDTLKMGAHRKHSKNLMDAYPDLVHPPGSAERLGAIIEAIDEADSLLPAMERALDKLRNYKRKMAFVGNTLSLVFYEGSKTGARTGQPAATRVVQELAPYHARTRRAKPGAEGEVEGEFDDADDEAPGQA